MIGTSFDDGFVILRGLARGAQTRVYLVSDRRVVRVLKLFPASLRWRAAREVALGRGLTHPHLNPVLREVEVAGLPGVLTPFVKGCTLTWPEEGATNAFLDTFTGLLEALGYLHAHGVIHQDVKPENVLVDASGHATLIDFDLAVRADDPHRRAAGGGFKGTPAFLSPEGARGERTLPGSDLYAAGVILYRAVTGEVPFTGSVEAVLSAHRHALPKPPSQFRAALAPYDALFDRLFRKNPEERHSCAEEVLRDLRAVRQEEKHPPSADAL